MPYDPPGLRPAEPRVVTGALRAVSAVNPYFAVATGPADPEAADPEAAGWRPLAVLHADPEILDGMVSGVARRLGTDERRIAASILFQGLAARFWSPAVGAAAAGVLVDLDPARVLWRPAPTGPLPLLIPRPAGWEVADAALAAGPLYRDVVGDLLEPLAHAVRETTRVAPGLLWGNAASALAGTLQTIAAQRPGAAARAFRLTRELLRLGVLRGTGELTEPAPGRPRFLRRSCCLYYRLPGGGWCGDCPLPARVAR
ncbi:hypothetical protein FHS43_005761 [Streptosporangium becharense]|uniref:Ferric siderophore reductase C-terminal domain-containing protein n=1 Tax=Streptosporangium becharense TaxID=1816182 RepID=A0A7W9IML1_9ACTN|nr:(2Fe-2S)-binding protein [Streptosporangium becharense]MBB2914449.1 hypothetical protein [Streptosporangium becharense]MBB5823519.1 hypothetical protein [Streptosporangium becharense]